MGNPIWAEARKRARSETLELLRLNSTSRALLTIGTPVVAFVATLGLTGQLAIAAAATLAWTALCGLMIYFGKLVRAPAKIAAEKQAELDGALGLREMAETLAAKRIVVAQAIEAAERLKGVCSTGGAPLPGAAIDEWHGAVRELVEELGPEYLARFDSEAGLLPLVPNGPLTKHQRECWTWLDHRAQRLHEFMRELR